MNDSLAKRAAVMLRRWWCPVIASALCLFAAGCASTSEDDFRPILPRPQPESWRLAILPPLVAPQLLPENLKPETDWYERVFDGRGAVVTSANIADEAALALATTLTLGNRFQRVVLVKSLAEADTIGATHVLIWTIHDYRSILRGANPRSAWLLLLGPLAPQYWIRWLTLEGRIDWEVEVLDLETKNTAFVRHLTRSYFRTIRYAQNKYLLSKMQGFLRFEACPEFVCDLFDIDKDERVPGRPAEPVIPDKLPLPVPAQEPARTDAPTQPPSLPASPAAGDPVPAVPPSPAPAL